MNTEHSSKNVLAPLNDAAGGRLIFTRGAANLILRVDFRLSSLCKARFQGITPAVQMKEDGRVEIGYPRFGFIPWLFAPEETGAEIVLNGAIPWSIEIQGGLSRLDADLRGLRLERFEVTGGVSKAFLQLPQPVGEVPLKIHGGVSRMTLSRPIDSAVRCTIQGGSSMLAFDEQRFGAIGGKTLLETLDFKGSSNRFNLEIGGGASRVGIETYEQVGMDRLVTVSR